MQASSQTRRRRLILVLAVAALVWALSIGGGPGEAALGVAARSLPGAGGREPKGGAPAQKPLDPAAWGSNHAGKPVPEYVHGDECLFCHRNDIGPGWQKNAHGLTVRQREDAPELQELLKGQPVRSQVEYFLGSRHRVRFLKKAGYGRFAVLSTMAVLGPDGRAMGWIDPVELSKPAWDNDLFANKCAGCHATGVDAKTRAFSAFGLDCYTCHGNVNLEHTGDTSLIWLSKKNRRDSKAIISTCAQCHLRMGKSRSTGLAYPNNFVAGDNLFQDYEVDFARAENPDLNPGDRHVLRNVRDVVLYGQETPTCLTCHQVHENSSFKHRRAPRTAICFDCHTADSYKNAKPYTVKSELCDY